jgi:hypothetical protein
MKTTLQELQELFHLKNDRQIKVSLVNKIRFYDDGVEVSGAKLEKLILKFRSEGSLTAKEVCHQYKISLYELNYLVKVNKIPYYQLIGKKGSKMIFFKSDLEKENPVKVFLYKGLNTAKFAKLLLSIFDNVDEVNDRDRKILTSHFVEGKSVEEIAKMLIIGKPRTEDLIRKNSRKLVHIIRYKLNQSKNVEIYKKKNKDLKFQLDFVAGQLKQLSPKSIEVEHIDFLNTRLVDLGLSNRCLNCLKAADFETVSDLLYFSWNDLSKFRNFGKGTLKEIRETLKKYGFELRNA